MQHNNGLQLYFCAPERVHVFTFLFAGDWTAIYFLSLMGHVKGTCRN